LVKILHRIFLELLENVKLMHYNLNLRMLGFEDFIKSEELSPGEDYQNQKKYTTDRDLVNHCLTTFYDQDSNDSIIQAKYSVK